MKRRFLSMILACIMLIMCNPKNVSATEEVTSGNTEKSIITGIDSESMIYETYRIAKENKPTKDELIAQFPEKISVFLNGEEEATEIDVTWFDVEGDYDSSGYYYFQFSPIWDEEKYQLDSSLDLMSDVPYIEVFFADGDAGISTAAATSYSNETAVYKFLRDKMDLPTSSICGILANIQKESGFNPSAYNGNDTGGTISYGICQWNNGAGAGNRYGKLMDWCESNGYDYKSLEGQLNYMKYELESNSYFRLSKLKAMDDTAQGAYDASKIWSIYYEGCAKAYYEERANLAKNTYWPYYSTLVSEPEPEPEPEPENPFSDVADTDWFYDAVMYMNEKDIMKGDNNLFSPNDNMSRAMMVTTLYRLAGSPEVSEYAASEEFSDIEEGAWYETAVNWAYNTEITTGYPDTMKFGVYDDVTREQLAVFLYRYAEYTNLDTNISADISGYTGYESISNYAEEAMSWAVGTKIISGVEKSVGEVTVYDLEPQGSATRAQLATILMRFCQFYGI